MKTAPTGQHFHPESWGQASKFSKFYTGTHAFKIDTTKAVTGVESHFRKAMLFYTLAQKLSSNLQIDADELNNRGHTPAINSAEFTAVAEGVFMELYSSIDCTRKVIFGIYSKCRSIKDSTRKLFQKIRNNELGEDFPQELKDAFLQADWYDELLRIRDELTHAEIGSCFIDPNTNLIQYMHTGIKSQGKVLVIPDIFGKIDTLISQVNQFIGRVFHYLNGQLKTTEITQVCGVSSGKILLRKLPLNDDLTFNSGTCISYIWFDKPTEIRCPFADNCGAYKTAKLIESSEIVIGASIAATLPIHNN